MPRYIIKLPCDGADYYLEWSSIVDAPVTCGMTWEEFKAHYRHRYGMDGLRVLPERLARVEKTGTSDATNRRPVRDWMKYNRAGVNETCLTYDEIIEEYIRNPRNPRRKSADEK